MCRGARRYFRIFIDAATLKHELAQGAPEDRFAFPHLYRCGHIEASRQGQTARPLRGLFPHLYRCGHIEARHEQAMEIAMARFPHLYRCGHIEAILTSGSKEQMTELFPHLYRCGHIEAPIARVHFADARCRFPHLYRCGHIEAKARSPEGRERRLYFRIFIDAATLKRQISAASRWRTVLISASL